MTASLRILDAGLAATIQDSGRRGLQRFGVPVSGALDHVSLRIANVIAGNPPYMAAIEIIGAGLVAEVEADSAVIAAAGMVSRFMVESGKSMHVVSGFRSFLARRGDILKIPPPKNGSVCYLAVEGGFDVAPVLGSRSTYRRAKIGGFQGRTLAKGDRLPLCQPAAAERPPVMLDVSLAAPEALRIMRGPNAGYFTPSAFETLLSSTYTVSPSSDRMGLRLQGPALERAIGGELPSQGTTEGGMQVPPDGLPIMLLADRQTTGGYPRIATVIGADIAAAGRLTAGIAIRFEEVTRDEAVGLLKAQQSWLASLPWLLKAAPADAVSVERLLSNNLIDGVTSAGEDNP
ncbi:MAG TPA: biotin-dependent carboxyltransferase family protein [Hyphomicrobiales bacterium]|nr:biotin-dependent carboxyltransferase family protein [Hyphomicrobiales bacterium]